MMLLFHILRFRYIFAYDFFSSLRRMLRAVDAVTLPLRLFLFCRQLRCCFTLRHACADFAAFDVAAAICFDTTLSCRLLMPYLPGAPRRYAAADYACSSA